jgi:indole-3-glycerol phosphate synthase
VSDFLHTMRDLKRAEVHALRGSQAAREAAAAHPKHPPQTFSRALRGSAGMGVIAEIKRSSPSKGLIRPETDVVARARRYEAGGASAISVLTEAQHFGGALEDLAQVAAAVPTPTLRKDFVLDPLQIDFAVAAGAAAVLLIVEFVSPQDLATLAQHAHARGLDVLLEFHEPQHAELALSVGAAAVGVNARNLKTLRVDTQAAWALGPSLVQAAARLPAPPVLVAESGITSPADAQAAWDAGFRACLVGESLMRQDDPTAAISALRAVGR